MSRSRTSLLLLSLSLAFPVSAQAPRTAVEFANAILAATAPDADDPDALAAELLRVTERCGGTSYAGLLLGGITSDPDQLQRPGELLPAIRALLANEDIHGLTRRTLNLLQYRLLRATASAEEALRHAPGRELPSSFLCTGPFGGDEDEFAGVAFAPELLPWTAQTEFRDTNRSFRPHVVTRRIGGESVSPKDPARGGSGCFYALHRVEAEAETQCYLQIDNAGTVELFVNGARIATHDPLRGNGRADAALPIGLAAGINHVLVKTCRRSQPSFMIAYVDARGRTVSGLREVPAVEPVATPPAPIAAAMPPYVDWFRELQSAIAAATAEQRDALSIAVGYLADGLGLREEPLALVTGLAPTDPDQQLSLARLWRRIELVPQEIRNSRARTLEEAAGERLGNDHWAMLRARVGLLAEKDQRERALDLLWAAVDEQRAGPATFRLLLETARSAKFAGERVPILERWRAILPEDPAPRIELADDWYRAGATRRAAEIAAEAVRLRPDISDNLSGAWRPLLDLGELDAANALRQLVLPDLLAHDGHRLTQRLWDIAAARRETTAESWLELAAKVIAHPDAGAATLRQLGGRLARRNHDELAIRAYERCLDLDPDDWQAARSVRLLRGEPAPGEAFARFRHDGREAIAAFRSSEREDGAAATVLVDQRIVEVFADGSSLVEIHELRRLNDPSAVDRYNSARGPAAADEVLLLRTITADGEEFVPAKVQREYAMPRLEPGAFLEWRYREHRSAPADGVYRVDEFLFRSTDEHLLLTELVVIQPATGKLELRSRNLEAPAEVIDLGDGRVAHRYTARDSLRLLPENAMPALATLVPVVAGGAEGSAVDRLRAGGRQLLAALRPTPPIRAKVDELLAELTEPAARLRALHEFCQIEIATERGGSPTSTLLLKKGNRQLLLCSMLTAAGFTLEPGLCESIREDLITGSGALFSDPERFFDAMALRVRAEGMEPQWLFFDAPRHWPAGRIIPQRAGGGALVATTAGIELTTLPGDPERSQELAIRGSGTLSRSQLEIEADIRMGGDEGFRAAEFFLQQPTNMQKQFARQFAQSLFAGWQIRDAEVAVLEPGRPVTVHATLRRRALQQDGDRLLLATPLPPGQVLARFGARPDRELPIRHTADFHLRWDIRLEVDDVRLAVIPATTALQFGPLRYLQEVRIDGDTVVLRRDTTMGSGLTPVAELGDWLAVLQQVERTENGNLEFVAR